MVEINLLDDISDAIKCYEVLVQLHPALSEAEFRERIERLYKSGYRLVALIMDDDVIAVAGFHISESFGWKKYIYVDDLVTIEDSRSQGFGTRLLDWLKDYARALSCDQIHLDSRVTRYSAHKFYLNNELYIGGYHFLEEL